ncbi:MAG: protein-glutamate O-methyltransferase CheR [Paracoccus sp. (in: a-proteobacteria)]|nr:protein-glutamate O-methyltransferase CheR [Paracoccus sp. (in: a-proteobacteria)]
MTEALDHDWKIRDSEFDELRAIIHDHSGIVIGAVKQSMVRARLHKRLVSTGMKTLGDYLRFVSSSDGEAERQEFIASLTTNVTHFFREHHHFEILTRDVLPGLAARTGPINIWSAGCSSGQEPYTIAMAVSEARPDLVSRINVLGTDIDHHMIRRCQTGFYTKTDVANISPSRLKRHFDQIEGGYRVHPAIAKMVRFSQHNLTAPAPQTAKYDVIFCRNVAIYFDTETQERLWSHLAASLKSGGWLFIGHSERLPDGLRTELSPGGATAYRRN